MKGVCALLVFFGICLVFARAEFSICATSYFIDSCKRIEAAKKDLKCLVVSDSVDCLQNILKKKAHFGTFTAEELLLVTHYANDNLEVIAEVRHPQMAKHDHGFEMVVVVGENFTGDLFGLKGASYCHPGFTQGRYWSDRVLKHFERKVAQHFEGKIQQDGQPRTAAEQELYTLTKIFRNGCRPGPWSASNWWDKKLKRTYDSLCYACDSSSSCSHKADSYNERHGPLKCLTENQNSVAYTSLQYVQEYFNINSHVHSGLSEEYKFLCENGTTLPLSADKPCTWLKQPWSAIVSLSAISPEITTLIREAISENLGLTPWKLALKKILLNGNMVAHLRSDTPKISDYIQSGRLIPEIDPKKRSIDWCTVSDLELSKCDYLAKAALVYGTAVQLTCSKAEGKLDCLKKIQKGKSDFTFIDTELGFVARKVHNLTAAAFVETEKTGNYYGVVVTKGNSLRRFRDLQGKTACFPQYNGLGWLSHVQNIRHLNLVPNMLCSDSLALWNYFSKACAPGVKSKEINKFSDLAPNKLCQACPTSGKSVQCNPTSDNKYYSEIGALRCLNDGQGDVAYLDFHTIKQHFDNKPPEDADMDLREFRILCRDESIRDFSLEDPEHCSISQLNGGEMVMRDGLSQKEKRDIVMTLIELDDLFGYSMKQYPPIMNMFAPFEGQTGVLFKDSSVALISAFQTQNEYVNNYLKLQNDMSICYRDNSAGKLYLSLLLLLPAIIIIFIE